MNGKTGIYLLAAIAGAFLAADATAGSDSFRRDCEALTRGPHRLTGTDEGRTASEYIENRLNEIKPDHVLVQEFPATQTRTLRCELVVQGDADGGPRVLQLLPMRPNGIIPPVTPEAGVTGPLVHLGAGNVDDYSGRSLEGAIVVLDYNAGTGWLRAFRLGAKAVIFTSRGTADSRNTHIVDANVNFLRFYYAGKPEDLPEGTVVTIHSEVVWEPVRGRNVFAFFRGTDPVFDLEKEELLVLAANFDTYGEVPVLSPGARSSSDCAGLLKLAQYFQKKRPRRHVLLAFFDGQARSHSGCNRFYQAIETENKNATVEKREELLDKEREILEQIETVLESDTPVTELSSVSQEARRQLMTRFSDNAAKHTFEVNDRMVSLRRERDELARRVKRLKVEKRDWSDQKARMDEIAGELAQQLQPGKDAWNGLRRALGRKELDELAPGVAERLEIVLNDVRRDVSARQKEFLVEQRGLQADKAIRKLVGDCWVAVHISLLLGDTTSRWGLVIGGDSGFRSGEDNPLLYARIQAVFLRAYQDMSEEERPAHFIVASADQTLSPTRILWPGPLIHSGEVAGVCGIYNLVLATCQEGLDREGTPHDTLNRLDLSRIETQVDEIAYLLSAVADLDIDVAAVAQSEDPDGALASQRGLSLRRGIQSRKGYRISTQGPMVMGVMQGSSVPNTPMPGAIVQIRQWIPGQLAFVRSKNYGFDDFLVVRTDQNGCYGMGPMQGGVGFAAVFDERGAVTEVSDKVAYESGHAYWRLNVFQCRSGQVVLSPQYKTWKLPGDDVQVLSAGANAGLDPTKSFFQTVDGIAYWYCDRRTVSDIKLFGERQVVALNIGQDVDSAGAGDDAFGRGYSMDPVFSPISAAETSSEDLWRLNEMRLETLRKRDIRDSSLEELHGRAEDLLIAARSLPPSLQREALKTCAFLVSQPVYRRIRAMMDDLVFAVLILLGLSVPFAFAMERVIIGGTTIYKQISWFLIFFVVTFIVLYLTHPAFAIAGTPIIIFLGFAVLLMSVLVIGILMRKFEVELKALQGMGGTVHATDISRVSTFMAAMQMGISTMRRRPLRTAMTAVTITLLTFTILCFASFGTQIGVVHLFRGTRPAYTGVWVRDLNWNPLAHDLVDVVRGRWGTSGELCRRLWLCPRNVNQPGMIATRVDGSSPVLIQGVLGIDNVELSARPDLAGEFGSDLKDRVLVTKALARKLQVEPGDMIILKGRTLRVGPLLDPVALSVVRDMDNASVLPVDFTVKDAGRRLTVDENIDPSSITQKNWSSLAADAVAVVSADTAYSLGADLCGVVLYTRDAASASQIADEMAQAFPLAITATGQQGVFLHVLGTKLAASGVKDLFFPILLGGLVVFGTMLGSVVDREKEIYTFSALGLAPRHVATLFFAESLVYSLIGGMGGYLLAQAVLKVLTMLAGMGLVTVPDINMFSTNTIVTILIVMGTVLISAVYPAIKASRSANPGLMRAWRPPAPVGDSLDLVFPFTVSEYDITGVVSFIKEHFDAHSDTGLGHFMAADTRVTKETKSLGLDSSVALAPFDLGVSQTFSLRSVPSEIVGIDEVKIQLRRLSGQPGDWRRLCKVFLNDLRRQFLIWRSLPHETMETYRERTLVALGRKGTMNDE
jgi:hypothetical protein